MVGTKLYIALIILSYALGVAAIFGCFYVQRLEDKTRPSGYHLKATLQKITPQKNRTKLDFSFFLKGQPITCSAFATKEQCKPIKRGNDYFIVYNEQNGECVFNPCNEYRKWQFILIVVSFFVIAFGTLLVIYGFSLWF